MHIADLHIHSRFSRATSRDCDAPHLDLWARRKGIGLIGTGDFTHPAWRQELRDMLVPAEEGLYRLKEELVFPCEVQASAPRFVVSGEISTIYKRGGKTRKVHHVILLPGLDEAEELSHRLEAIGNLHSDGRPILGLDSRDLLEIILECCPRAIYIPAHIWTPHFSLFGAFSDFSTVEECFADMTPYIHAMETGLSSDPLMNRRLSMLDQYTLVSNSDAHSPAKLGREANLLDCEMSFPALKRAIETGEGFHGTVEFYPEEGKYHLDGHRNCHCCLEPAQTVALGGRCPVCGRKLTVGVLHRVEALADRSEPAYLSKPFESLMPLPELLADCMGVSAASKRVEAAYFALLKKLGPEFDILRTLPLDTVRSAAGDAVAEGLRRLREGHVIRNAGYDGEYGTIRLFEPGELERFLGQTSLIGLAGLAEKKTFDSSGVKRKQVASENKIPAAAMLNEGQSAAVHTQSSSTAVIAGPGTGKTKTLVSRIAQLIEEGVLPGEITAVTFTRQAAKEMLERLTAQLGKKAVKGLTVGTFHAICMTLIPPKPIVTRAQSLDILTNLLEEHEARLSPAECLRRLSLYKNNLCRLLPDDHGLPQWLPGAYAQRLEVLGLRDLDDVLLDALNATVKKQFTHLLVDEFQDINAVQHQLVMHWSKKSKSLFVIGDPDQAIYGFRGAQADCFDRFLAVRPETELIRLHENYRSSPQILEAALNVIRRNPGMERELTAHQPDGATLRMMQAPDGFSEAIWIAKEISGMVGGVDMLEAHHTGTERNVIRSFSDIAILCRTHRQLEQIENALTHDSIPCIITGHDDFLSSKTVQGMLGFFTSLCDPSDSASLHTAFAHLWYLPAELAQRASVALASHVSNELNFDVIREELADFPLTMPWVDAAQQLYRSREKPRKQLERLAALCSVDSEAVDKLLNAAVFYDSMTELISALRTCGEGDISRVCGSIYASGAVQLMTLHAAKGLEFPVVFLAGITEGVFPLENAHSVCDIEEERRLFFVGITRAKEELIASCSGNPSFFWNELPASAVRGSIRARNRIPKMEQLTLF
ncbi:MAG: UvrD-helicase domain-containing protein [Clostridia bacterium]|nr:UvrD-helicase domain-containing protein [Clostridia bacterium]